MIFSVISKIKDSFGTHATEQVENREVGQKTVTLLIDLPVGPTQLKVES